MLAQLKALTTGEKTLLKRRLQKSFEFSDI